MSLSTSISRRFTLSYSYSTISFLDVDPVALLNFREGCLLVTLISMSLVIRRSLLEQDLLTAL